MSGQWEQYVEKAALAMHRERFGPDIPWGEFGPVMEEMERAEVRAVLAAVGPLIAEDTRTRMVGAAAAAVKREATDLVHLRCPHCGGELYVETEPTGGYYSEDRIDRIECETFECGATWDRSGVALLKPRKLCGTCETSQRTADDLGGNVSPHDKVFGGKCPGDPT